MWNGEFLIRIRLLLYNYIGILITGAQPEYICGIPTTSFLNLMIPSMQQSLDSKGYPGPAYND